MELPYNSSHNWSRRRSANLVDESGPAGWGGNTRPGKHVRHVARPRFHGIAFNYPTTVFPHMVGGSSEQRDADTTAPKFFVDQEANDGPDRLVVNWLQQTRALWPDVLC